MARYLLSRLVQTALVVIAVLVVVFMMVHLVPGDPVQAVFGDTPVPKDRVEAVRHQLGLDLPLQVQFAQYISRMARGDLGRSLLTERPVATDLVRVLPYTAELAVAALFLAVVGGIFFGIVSAILHNKWLDSALTAVALLGVSVPAFWAGLLLIWIFSIDLGWFPIIGQGGLQHLVLPAVTLGWYAGGILTRLTRSGMLEVLHQDYVMTARAKGLPEVVVLVRHALRNALIPIITFVSIQFGYMLGGAVIVETVFARDGLGRVLVNGILEKDFPIVQGGVLFVALAYAMSNLLADLSYSLIDPRIRYEE